MSLKVFVDLDGVLADMAAGYLAQFGAPLDRNDPDPADMWDRINTAPRFFEDLPLTADALILWRGIKALGITPIVLSAYSEKCADAPDQKRRWVRRWLGKHAHMIFCKASEKCVFGSAGDVLIDDWPKHRGLWEAMGGQFLLHTSAATSLAALRDLVDAGTMEQRWRRCEDAYTEIVKAVGVGTMVDDIVDEIERLQRGKAGVP